jgi:hypothetical protein
VRRDSGEGYREMLTRMAEESGIETPRSCRNFCVGGHTVALEGRRDVWRFGTS